MQWPICAGRPAGSRLNGRGHLFVGDEAAVVLNRAGRALLMAVRKLGASLCLRETRTLQ